MKNSKNRNKESDKKRIQLYSVNWDIIRKKVYARDNFRCVLCGKKTKLSCHHIVPVRISHDNSMSNLVSVCESCHKKLESIGFTILEKGGGTADIRKVELKMIAEAKEKRSGVKNGKNRSIDERNINNNKGDERSKKTN